MSSASTLTTALFVLLVVVMTIVAVRTILRAHSESRRGARWAALVVVLYLIVPGLLARAGMLDRYDPMPAPGLLVILALAILTAALAFSGLGARIISTVGLAALVGYQAFRIPVEWLLHRLYAEGAVPVQMTYAGRNFDIVTGITALVLALWLARSGSRPRGIVLAWNLLGLALLANIVTIAVLSAPVSFRRFPDGPPNLLPSEFPFVWLPTFLVQLALFGHLVVFRALSRERQGDGRA